MKAVIALFALVLSFHVAQAGEACPDAGKAIQAYLTAIQKDAQVSRDFKKEVSKLIDSGVKNDLYNPSDMSALCVAQGVSMHSGVVSSRQTYLISHSLRAGGAGLVNDISVLSLVTISGETSQNGEDSEGPASVRITHLK